MANIHKLQKLGENQSGAKLGVELPKDDLRLAGFLDEEGNVIERPHLSIQFDPDQGDWELHTLDE